MQTARTIDDNGFLLVKGCPLSSFGIFDYSAAQVGLDGDPNRIVKVYRPESAVNDPAAIESFKNLPFIDEHVLLHGYDDNEGMAPEKKGVDGILTSNIYYDAPWLRGDLKVFSRKLQYAINKKKSDLSLGYGCSFTHSPGTWDGQPYEVVQENLRGNHIALVGEGRVPGARVLDGMCFDHLSFEPVKYNEEESMILKKKKAMDSAAVEKVKALLPQLTQALSEFMSEESTEPAHQGGGEQTEETVPDASANQNEETAQGGVASGASEAPVEQAQVDPINSSEESNAEVPAPAAEGGEGAANASEGGEGGGDALSALISEVESLLAQLKSATSGGNAADEEMSNEETAVDAVEGLQESSHPGAQVAADGIGAEQPKASPGPSAGAHATASDSALRHFYADVAIKTGIYDRLSKIVGAFDHSAMDSAQVVAYGVKKLNLKVGDSKGIDVLSAHLEGIESAERAAAQKMINATATDSVSSVPEIDAYIKGNK